ncbi:MAG: elongation factor P, partial [Alphaproteobacteria bacterium]
MKINANDIRVGNVLDHEGKLWVVMKTMHTQPGT